MTSKTLDPARLNNPHEAPHMLEWMTEEEWTRRYPDEWVLVIDPNVDEQKNLFQSGFVAFHGVQRDQMFAEAKRLRPKDCAFTYTGNGPQNMEYVL